MIRAPKYRRFKNLKTRPEDKNRLFKSSIIESEIKRVSEKIKDPEIQKMFENVFQTH